MGVWLVGLHMTSLPPVLQSVSQALPHSFPHPSVIVCPDVQGIVRCYENLLKIREGWPTRAPTIFVAHVERHALALPEVAHVLRDVLVGPVDGHPPQVDDLIHAVFTGLRRAFHPPVKCELGGHQQRKRNEAPALPPRSHRLPHVLPLDLESESDVFFSLDRIQVCILRIDGYAVPFEVFRTIYAVTMHDVSEAVPILVYPLQFCGPEGALIVVYVVVLTDRPPALSSPLPVLCLTMHVLVACAGSLLEYSPSFQRWCSSGRWHAVQLPTCISCPWLLRTIPSGMIARTRTGRSPLRASYRMADF